MDIQTFISNNEVEYSKNLIDTKGLAVALEIMKVQFGKELTDYVLKYGYLAYKHFELYGINSVQFLDSDMIKQTVYLHKYYPETKGYITLENQGDGDYFLVDENDYVWEFDIELRSLIPTNNKLYEHILQRFNIFDDLIL